MVTLIGKIVSCISKRQTAATVSDITELEIIPKAEKTEEFGGGFVVEGIIERREKLSNGEEGLKMNLRGIHRIDEGETIKVGYDTHSSVHWIGNYQILKDDGKVVYTYEG